ncbi:HERV-H LTR-associating protein 1 [Manis javanica]|uniref:HERV-H LTR-associating protein 1 n=1 Tax=Manis javanica TaxID=9974 RepID=UPI003C6CF29D
MLGFLVPGPLVRLCVGLACVLSLWNTVSGNRDVKKEKDVAFLVSGFEGEEKKEQGMAFLDTTELPARSVDLSALNLTELVNGMLRRALKDSKRFFSLLSITSYSSFAFHKLSVAIYNISNLKTVDPVKFPTRYCYCLNNRTSDVSDFTALLVDVIGNSTSFLTEIFKSTSILSVSQMNESDCIFICTMTGKSGRNLSDFWEMAEKSPVINYTFTSSMSGVLGDIYQGDGRDVKARAHKPADMARNAPSARSPGHQSVGAENLTQDGDDSSFGGRADGGHRQAPPAACQDRGLCGQRLSHPSRLGQAWASTLPVPWAQSIGEKTPGAPPWKTRSSTPTSPAEAMSSRSLPGPPAWTAATRDSPSQTSQATGTFTAGTQTPSPTKAPAPRYPQTGDFPAVLPFAPGEQPALLRGPHRVSRCPQPFLKEGAKTAASVTPAIQKLSPCLMELCRFFQQCLCRSQRRDPRVEAMRYCLEHYSWFLKNATYICQRVERVSHSHTLKQKCLENICKSV